DGIWDRGPEYWSTIRLADIDGDGKADLCGRGPTGIVCGINTFFSWFQERLFWVSSDPWDPDMSDANGWNQPPYYSTIQFVDADGDGHRADVCARGGGGVYCDVSNGTNAFVRQPTAFATDFSDGHGWNTVEHYSTIRVIDIDGDGVADVCGRGSAG